MPDVAATLQILDNQILLDRTLPSDLDSLPRDPSHPVYIDVRGGRNPATKGRNARFRLAVSPGWQAEFRILWEASLINRETMESVCRDAGLLVGIADGRMMGFGRFEIVSFESRVPRKRPPRDVWKELRYIVWNRDQQRSDTASTKPTDIGVPIQNSKCYSFIEARPNTSKRS